MKQRWAWNSGEPCVSIAPTFSILWHTLLAMGRFLFTPNVVKSPSLLCTKEKGWDETALGVKQWRAVGVSRTDHSVSYDTRCSPLFYAKRCFISPPFPLYSKCQIFFFLFGKQTKLDPDTTFPFIELRITSNHGHPDYTCLYRFRVHGLLVKRTD